MPEHKTLVIDIDPRVNYTTEDDNNQPKRAEKRLWAHTDNSFTFNFFPEGAQATQGETSSLADVNHQFARLQTKTSTASTELGSGFVFNFQIPVSTLEEMEKESEKLLPTEVLVLKESDEKKPQNAQQAINTTGLTPSDEAKKNKKSTQKKKGCKEKQKQMPNSTDTEGACVEDSKVLTAEQQLKRELDWCIEQLELGMMTQKATTKQKEASRAIKTLRSSKAPLAKKRQVMRAMSGDYRNKMMEEKGKQFKLIQAAMTSAQVKAVADSSKRSVFHRKAENKTDALHFNDDAKSKQDLQAQTPNTSVLGQDSNFVFIHTKEEFCFNFF